MKWQNQPLLKAVVTWTLKISFCFSWIKKKIWIRKQKKKKRKKKTIGFRVAVIIRVTTWVTHVSNTELISMMCHDDAIVKLPRNYTLSVPVRSLLERGSFLVPPELFTFYPPGEGKVRGNGQGWGKKLSSDACRFLVAHNIRFCGVSTMSWHEDITRNEPVC